MSTSSLNLLPDLAYVLKPNQIKSATLNIAVTTEGETNPEEIKSTTDHLFRLELSEYERAIFNKIYFDGTAQANTSIIIRGSQYIKGQTRPNFEEANVVSLLTPLFVNKSLRTKEAFNQYRTSEPEHKVIQSSIGCFVSCLTQHGVTVDPTAPNYGSTASLNDEGTLFNKLPAAKEVDSFEVSAYSGNLLELHDLQRGYSYPVVLTHIDPYIRTKIQILHDRKFLVVTEINTYPENVLRFEDGNLKNYIESLYKAPKSFEPNVLEFLVGEPGLMSSILGILEYFEDFKLAYIQPGAHVYNPISTENVLVNKKGFLSIDSIGQL